MPIYQGKYDNWYIDHFYNKVVGHGRDSIPPITKTISICHYNHLSLLYKDTADCREDILFLLHLLLHSMWTVDIKCRSRTERAKAERRSGVVMPHTSLHSIPYQTTIRHVKKYAAKNAPSSLLQANGRLDTASSSAPCNTRLISRHLAELGQSVTCLRLSAGSDFRVDRTVYIPVQYFSR